MDTMCGLRPGWPHGALEKVAPARDARALRALTRTWGGPSGSIYPGTYWTSPFHRTTGSAQLILNKTKPVEYTNCNKTVVIPCFVSNVEATTLDDLYLNWKFGNENVLTFVGSQRTSTTGNNFSSASIVPEALLEGTASLKLDKSDAVPGNYTCEVTELSREGEAIIELKYRVVNWFSPNENILIIIFPMLAILLFWGQFGVVTLKYNSSVTKEKTILLFVVGLVLTIVTIVGAILFIPGEHSTARSSGLGLIVVPTVILILLQYAAFMIAPAIGMSFFSIAILILQVLGFVLSVVGLRLCILECVALHSPLLISGLGIIALAELLGLVYMKFIASNQRTIQPPRSK
ncbi:leukocyte surface antigen CD47 isoform X3 [Rousettus aegyptiacus]|uniref:leukocyte surface antigen CD47 isoform X3 n=1 Tax=Rousettus aegyptiacus TaxID=9407 RepID=UPI00168D8868|nr:leukocyte surface antigen CD47 isoform X3 [Rousettus aegyptiacus]